MYLCSIHLFYLTSDKIFMGHASNTTFKVFFFKFFWGLKDMLAPFQAFWGAWPECSPTWINKCVVIIISKIGYV